MTLNDLIKLVSQRTGYPRQEAQVICQELIDVLVEELLLGHNIGIQKLGQFFWDRLKERQINHPKTGQRITAPARLRLKFRPGLDLRSGLLDLSEAAMDKYGVDTGDSKEKVGSDGKPVSTCPQCGATLDSGGACPNHGTEPFEKRPEPKKK